MTTKRRLAEREPIAVPVNVAGCGEGITRDISTSGLYLSVEGDFTQGKVIDFSITLTVNNKPVLLVGQGEVVRVEAQGKQTGVAIRMLNSQLQEVD
jgi:nitrous oxidase accessory protein NosD